MKIIYQDLQKELKRRFTILQNKKFSKTVEQIKPNANPFWKLSKVFKKPQKPIPPLQDGDRILLTNQEKIKNMKAPGDDGIFYDLLKRLPETALGFLVRIFNKCWPTSPMDGRMQKLSQF